MCTKPLLNLSVAIYSKQYEQNAKVFSAGLRGVLRMLQHRAHS